MLEYVPGSIQGFVKIKDVDTGEILVDTHNDVLYGNVSTAAAHSLIGNPNTFLSYMAFGNGGAYVDTTGLIRYKESKGGVKTAYSKSFSENLYNTIYVKAVYNNSTSSVVYSSADSKATISNDSPSTNYTDILVDVLLKYNEPGDITGQIQQSKVDNSEFIGTAAASPLSSVDEFVFNEIGLFAGSTGSNALFTGPATITNADVVSFTNRGYNTAKNAASKLMLTHVVFHPIQKAANRALQILYTLRIQIGAK